MTTFHYPLPESEPTSPWGGFSDEARTALTRIAMGPSPANRLLTADGNGAEGLTAEAHSWANAELNNNFADGALGSWRRYETALSATVPSTVDELLQTNPNLAPTLTRLHAAKQALTASGEVTPEGLNLGETMHLVVMPWQVIRDNVGSNFGAWVNQMRGIQNTVQSSDNVNDRLLSAITENQPLYRAQDDPKRSITPTEYLDRKIAQDGAWGIMLIQTSDQAGLKRIVEGPVDMRSSDAMTNNGVGHFEIAGIKADNLGIFEWLATSFQEDPSKLSNQDFSWMLANRMTVNGAPFVPRGDCYDGQVRSVLIFADGQFYDTRVRLAVM